MSKQAMEWIPTTERLPSHEEWLRAYCRNVYDSEFIVMIKGADKPTTLFFRQGFWRDMEGNFYEVVAWMNMPDPYQENKEEEEMCRECCGDNRFEVIEKAKNHILEATNIKSSQEEMQVLDQFLFRCWQMGWLDKYDETKTDWIPVSERLPKKAGFCWVTTAGPTKGVRRVKRIYYHPEAGWGTTEEKHIVAWMPCIIRAPYLGDVKEGRNEHN